jgi:DNA-binding MarR family transcriptional regulator
MDRNTIIEETVDTSEVIVRAWKVRFSATLRAEGITYSQMHALTALKEHRSMIGKDLADYMQLTPSSVTQLIESLVQNGYVARQQDEEDRRNVYLHLTESGQQKIAHLREARKKILETFNSTLSDEELLANLERQKKILANIQSLAQQK